MDIKKIAIEISNSKNEEKLNRYVYWLSHAPLQTQMHVCHELFKKFDDLLDEENNSAHLLSTYLTIPVELAKYHQNNETKLSVHQKNQLIESISSHFLARSNRSNESLRLAIIYFFSQVCKHEKWKQKRILERFGENLLRSIFNIYINDKKRAPIALHFLTEHMEIFLSTSPDLAAMTNTFFQNYMFKNQASCIHFMNEYKNYLLQNERNAPFFVIHTAFLIRQAFDLDHEILSFNLLKILIQYVAELSVESQGVHYAVATKILLQSKTLKGREIALQIQKEFASKQKISLKQLAKQFSMSFSSQSAPIKKNKSTEQMSLFKKILNLCTDE